jgi:uncharacterized protein
LSAEGPPPRYTSAPLPPYAYLPGRSPHPRRHPQGHSHGRPEPAAAAFPAADWRESEPWRRGVDLYNHGFWWESHEVFEALWKAFGRDATPEGRLLHALVWLAAARLKAHGGARRVSLRFAGRARSALEASAPRVLGADVAALARRLDACLESGAVGPIEVRLPELEDPRERGPRRRYRGPS